MADSAEEPVYKRRRTTTACDSCRVKKAKCDGKRPVCGRCAGYDFLCTYSGGGVRDKRHQEQQQQLLQRQVLSQTETSSPPSWSGRSPSTGLGGGVKVPELGLLDRYHQLVRDLASPLPEPSRAEVEHSLAVVRRHLMDGIATSSSSLGRSTVMGKPDPGGASGSFGTGIGTGTGSSGSSCFSPGAGAATPRNACRPSLQRLHSQRYLGQISDVHYFHVLTSLLRDVSWKEGSIVGMAGLNLNRPIVDNSDGYDDRDDEPAPPPYHYRGESDHHLGDVLLDIPDAEADRYVDIYFSTIHVAYPFVPRSQFERAHRSLRARGRQQQQPEEDINTTALALQYAILAIGAFYTSFLTKGATGPANSAATCPHETYFRWSLYLSCDDRMERSIAQVSVLLAQCFYLLAVCRTDKCWTTLGLAVRIAQSLGLHVENEEANNGAGAGVQQQQQPSSRATGLPVATTRTKTEIRRRVWHSLYVLDRLLALQLGRPPAIHDSDCHVPLPSRLPDDCIDWDAEVLPREEEDADDGAEGVLGGSKGSASGGDYFIHVIKLSGIIGQVLRELNNPQRPRGGIVHELPNTRALDRRLLDWKMSLPRSLRFDFGHALEKSMVLKKQRNMLAIKFHHLRALIHRPYLCLPLLQGPEADPATTAAAAAAADNSNKTLMSEVQAREASCYERICISEAQRTAQLLHHISDETELVHDFPWWQMISCLICASSILLIASAFVQHQLQGGGLGGGGGAAGGAGSGGGDDESCAASASASALGDPASLAEDAETCLKIFDALGRNSDAARVARDMMQKLRDQSLAFGGGQRPTRPGLGRGSSGGMVMERNGNNSSSSSSQVLVEGGGGGGGGGSLHWASSAAHGVRPSLVSPMTTAVESLGPGSLDEGPLTMTTPGGTEVYPGPGPGHGGDGLDFSAAATATAAAAAESCFMGADEWPMEISDSMAWSVQFFPAMQAPPGHIP